MLNLILKDIAIQKRTILFGFLYVTVFVVAFREVAFIAGTVMLVYMLMQTPCAYDDKSRADLMLNSLPVERGTIVAAKYLAMIVYAAIACAEYLLVYLFVKLSGIPLEVQGFSAEGLIGLLAAAGLFSAIFYPIFFRFGYLKTRYVNVVIFAAFFGAGSFALVAFKDSDSLKALFAALESQPGWAIVSAVAGVFLGIALVSYLLSVRFYKRREF
jgi:hypothetical protein